MAQFDVYHLAGDHARLVRLRELAVVPALRDELKRGLDILIDGF